MPPRDASATRARILDSAIAEFAARGLAGGRVDRIAREADTNVRMIYAYYGGKDGLFDAALASALGDLASAVPPRADDLPGWAGDLFDHHLADPSALRLSLWAQLERPAATAEPRASYLAKTATVDGASPLAAVDLLVIVYAIAQAWMLSPVGLLAADGSDPDDPARIAAHRRAAVAAVERIVAPARSPATGG